MVTKIFICFFILTSIIGCCYNGKISKYGLPRKEINKFKESTTYDNIDTLSLYKIKINFHFNNLTKEYTYYENDDDNSYEYTSYLKFYPKGKLGLFIIPKIDTVSLQRCFFDPLKAKMGYYWIEGDFIKTKILTLGDCTLYVSNNKGKIKGNNITLQDKTQHGNIYLKKKVSKVLIENWSPDW